MSHRLFFMMVIKQALQDNAPLVALHSDVGYANAEINQWGEG